MFRKRGALVGALMITVIIVGVAVLSHRGPGHVPVTQQTALGEVPVDNEGEDDDKVVKSDAEWQAQLTGEQFYVTRRKGTERAFSGAYWNSKKDGIYTCVCCGQPLFDSKTKYDSGTGWPSFWGPIGKKAIALHDDSSIFLNRTETVCRRCGAHLGHVFSDGPAPTGQRYCMNSAALKFVPRVVESRDEAAEEPRE